MDFVAWGPWTSRLVIHLWQSTVFAGGMWLLALALRRNAARLRYWLWMAASLKFLVPFSLLIAARARLPCPAHLERAQPTIAAAVEGVAQPFLLVLPVEDHAGFAAAEPVGHPVTDWLPLMLLGVWAGGTLLLLARWTVNWLRLRAAVRRGQPVTLADRTPARLMAENVEPGVFGIVQPVLVLPRGIADRLSAEQLEAIVAHEMCHVRRRDNLTAALHMAVEALFWFHPLVWWLRARLVEERERACDEAVLETTREPYAYAEGILNVCKFYVEVPLSCVSGVTGSQLKQRIAWILSAQGVRKLDVRRKALLAVACVLAVAAPVTAGLVRAAQGQTQPADRGGSAVSGITGSWQGTVHTPDGHDLRVVLKIAKDEKGRLSGTLHTPDRDGPPMGGSSVSFERGTLRFVNDFPGLTYEGKMSADGNSIGGSVTQNRGSIPLVLERATPETEWAIPAAPPRIPAMAADAHPSFEVATIKPSPPDARRSMFRMRGGELVIENLSLNDLLKFVYGVQNRQIADGPGWIDTDKWDIDAKPDSPGMPSQGQLREMVRKLLANRFALKLHEEKREMAAYSLTVGKDGSKMTKSSDMSQLGGFSMGPMGVLRVRSGSMQDFANVLQGNILDRPVVDETGLTGRWNFVLHWTPDETQFAGMKIPPPSVDDANAAPPLFTAIQEQLGLKLESRKADVPVIVIDHVEHPTPN